MLVVEPELAALENVRAGKADGLAAEGVDGFDDFRIDFARQHVIHDFHRCFVGNALAMDEIRLQPGFFHGAGDGLAATVNDDGIDFDRFQKNDVAGDPGADVVVRRIMKLPPYLTTKVAPLNFWMYGNASSSVSALAMRSCTAYS